MVVTSFGNWEGCLKLVTDECFVVCSAALSALNNVLLNPVDDSKAAANALVKQAGFNAQAAVTAAVNGSAPCVAYPATEDSAAAALQSAAIPLSQEDAQIQALTAQLNSLIAAVPTAYNEGQQSGMYRVAVRKGLYRPMQLVSSVFSSCHQWR